MSPRLRSALPAVLVALTAFGWMLWRRSPVPRSTFDALRDHLFARGNLTGAKLELAGAATSQFHLRQGALWPDVIGVVQLFGGGTNALHLVLVTLYALAALVTFLLARRVLGETPALVSAALWLVSVPALHDLSTTSNPELMALPAALFCFSLWRLLEDGEALTAAATGVFLSLCIDSHVAALVLVPAFAVALVLSTARLARGLSAGLGGLLAMQLLTSPVAFASNLVQATYWAPLPWALASGVGLLFAVARLRPRWRTWPRHVQAALVATVAALPFAGFALRAAITEASWEPRYLSPLAPMLAIAGGALTLLFHSRHVRAALALFVLMAGAGATAREDSRNWDGAVRIGAALVKRGVTYGELYNHLVAARRVSYLGGFLLHERQPPDGRVTRAEDLAIVEVDRSRLPLVRPPEWRLIEISADRVAVLRALRPSIDRRRVTLCAGAQEETCRLLPIDPEAFLTRVGAGPVRRLFPHQSHDFPPELPLRSYGFPVRVPPGEARYFDVLPTRAVDPGRERCRWVFGESKHRVRVEDGQDALIVNAHGTCGVVGRELPPPPPILETREDERLLRELVDLDRQELGR